MEPKFEIFEDKKKQYRWRLIAGNGEIVCQSEAYESKQGCLDTIRIISEIANKAKTVDLTK